MSFGTLFDGYCVIHAPFVTAERRPWFERELRRVGVDKLTIVEAPQIAPDDPRLDRYGRTAGELSLLEAHRSALRLAIEREWRHVVVMEDDIVFVRRSGRSGLRSNVRLRTDTGTCWFSTVRPRRGASWSSSRRSRRF